MKHMIVSTELKDSELQPSRATQKQRCQKIVSMGKNLQDHSRVPIIQTMSSLRSCFPSNSLFLARREVGALTGRVRETESSVNTTKYRHLPAYAKLATLHTLLSLHGKMYCTLRNYTPITVPISLGHFVIHLQPQVQWHKTFISHTDWRWQQREWLPVSENRQWELLNEHPPQFHPFQMLIYRCSSTEAIWAIATVTLILKCVPRPISRIWGTDCTNLATATWRHNHEGVRSVVEVMRLWVGEVINIVVHLHI